MSDTLAQGLPVRFVSPGSPAELAGLKAGDIILIANGLRINSDDAYVQAREIQKDLLTVTIQRGNQILDLEIRMFHEFRP